MTREPLRGGSSEAQGTFADAQIALSKALEALQRCPLLTMAERDLAFRYSQQIDARIWDMPWQRDDGSVVG